MIEMASRIFLSYLIGSIPFSILAGKLMKGIDIRQYGSGNAGGTNSFRVLGFWPGLIVSILDVSKGYIATAWISQLSIWESSVPVHPSLMMIFCGFSGIIGHIWTLFAQFRGGKGVAAAAGMLLGMHSIIFLSGMTAFAVALFFSRMVSLSSILACSFIPIFLYLGEYFQWFEIPLYMKEFSILIALVIILKHRSNITRILNGSERKIGKQHKD